MGCGIKINYSSECIISNNLLYRYEKSESDEGENDETCLGIYIKENCGNNKIYDNSLYYYNIYHNIVNKAIGIIEYSENSTFSKAQKFDPLSPIRYIIGEISTTSSQTIVIPEQDVPLNEDEEFALYIPEEYYTPTVSSIAYDGYIGYIYDNKNIKSLGSYRGQYVRLKYHKKTSSLSGQIYIEFDFIE